MAIFSPPESWFHLHSLAISASYCWRKWRNNQLPYLIGGVPRRGWRGGGNCGRGTAPHREVIGWNARLVPTNYITGLRGHPCPASTLKGWPRKPSVTGDCRQNSRSAQDNPRKPRSKGAIGRESRHDGPEGPSET